MENTKKDLPPLRVWWIQNIPNKAKTYSVSDIDAGLRLLDKLANKDLKSKFVVSNAGGLQYFLPLEEEATGLLDIVEEQDFDGWNDFEMDRHFGKEEFIEEAKYLGFSFSDEAVDKYFGKEEPPRIY